MRLAFALLGAAIVMMVFGFGISFDVDNLAFAVFDRDNSHGKPGHVEELRGSRYFVEKAPIRDQADIDSACNRQR